MTTIECFFDCSSPWTYLAFTNLQPQAREFGLSVRWRPFLVGGVFNPINPTVYASRTGGVPGYLATLARSSCKQDQPRAGRSGDVFVATPREVRERPCIV